MSPAGLFAAGLGVTAAAAALTWIASVARHDVSIVDSLWGVLFLLAAGTFAALGPAPTPRTWLMLALVGAWSLRLSVYITLRNHGHGEDRRYQQIRQRNEPHFAFKSLYLVFLLQAVLASVVSLPLLGVALGRVEFGVLDNAGVALWVLGMVFEVGGDWQLARFKADPGNRGRVMDRGLWAFTRHPNYFGEFCIWWGFYLLAVAAGAWWSVPGPLLMSLLLLRVSGVALLEKDIGERRPQYAEYVRRTNAFFPGPRRP